MITTIHCGIDEAGRGPLCGPVTAAAVILPQKNPILGLRDSKKLSEKKRTSLATEIKEHSIWGLGWVSAEEIDQINIHKASLLAMKRAWLTLLEHPRFSQWKVEMTNVEVTVDGKYPPDLNGMRVTALIGGDDLDPAISAASILAKTERDSWIEKWVLMRDPEDRYGLLRHKGYPTKFHREKLREFGPTEIHRKSYKLL